jgi:hypothetical protein
MGTAMRSVPLNLDEELVKAGDEVTAKLRTPYYGCKQEALRTALACVRDKAPERKHRQGCL